MQQIIKDTVHNCKWRLKEIRNAILHWNNYNTVYYSITSTGNVVLSIKIEDRWDLFYDYLLHLNSLYVVILESKVSILFLDTRFKLPCNICYCHQRMRECLGAPKGHTHYDVEYCLNNYKECIPVDINPELSYPGFVRRHYLPNNIKAIVFNSYGVGDAFLMKHSKLKAQSSEILLNYMNRVYRRRKYEFELISSNWIRTLSSGSQHILDIDNLNQLIMSYHYIIKYNHKTLRTSIERYSLLSTDPRPGMWDNYCKPVST